MVFWKINLFLSKNYMDCRKDLLNNLLLIIVNKFHAGCIVE